MKRCLISILTLTTLFLFAVTTSLSASETEYNYIYNEGDAGPNYPSGQHLDVDTGVFKKVSFTYESIQQKLTVEITMAPPTNFPVDFDDTKSFVLILSDAKQPHPAGGEYAVFYFDATRTNPVLTAYTYEPSSEWDSGSWFTGDKLCTSQDPTSCNSWIDTLSATNNADGSRTFRFSAFVEDINNFTPSNQNPAGDGWRGAQFGQQIGFWLTPYAYPNMQYYYNNNGFLSLLIPGQDPGIEYHGFFDGDHKWTFREPYCTGPAIGNVTIDPGQPYCAIFTGKSPDARPLTVNYNGVPTGGTVNPADGFTDPNGMITSEFCWTPTVDDAGSVNDVEAIFSDAIGDATCGVQVIVSVPDKPPVDCEGVPGGDAELDRCEVCEGDGNSCLNCGDTDILQSQFDMDQSALALFYNVKKTTRKLVRLNDTAENRAFRRKTNKAARVEYQFAWTTTWSFEQIITTCANTEFCVAISNIPTLIEYNDSIDTLFALGKRSRKEVKQEDGKTKKLRNQAVVARSEAQAAAGQIPIFESECDAPA